MSWITWIRNSLSSVILCRELGRYLAEQDRPAGILRNAYLKGVPVFIPAFTDSELGLDMANWMIQRAMQSGKSIMDAFTTMSLNFNPFLDLGVYTPRNNAGQKAGNLHHRRRRAPELGPQVAPFWNCKMPLD